MFTLFLFILHADTNIEFLELDRFKTQVECIEASVNFKSHITAEDEARDLPHLFSSPTQNWSFGCLQQPAEQVNILESNPDNKFKI